MTDSQKVEKAQKIIYEKCGYVFKDVSLIETALTHASYANQRGIEDYNRLEFLGDSLINMIVAEKLYKDYPLDTEKELTKKRANLVSEEGLTPIANSILLQDCIFLGKGSIGGKKTLSDVIESIIAAIYLDSNSLDITRNFVLELLKDSFNNMEVLNKIDYKSKLNEKYPGLVRYGHREISYDAKRNEHLFEAILYINDKKCSSGQGRSKEDAEVEAAKKFLNI